MSKAKVIIVMESICGDPLYPIKVFSDDNQTTANEFINNLEKENNCGVGRDGYYYYTCKIMEVD